MFLSTLFPNLYTSEPMQKVTVSDPSPMQSCYKYGQVQSIISLTTIDSNKSELYTEVKKFIYYYAKEIY